MIISAWSASVKSSGKIPLHSMLLLPPPDASRNGVAALGEGSLTLTATRLAAKAFQSTLSRKQSKYGEVLNHLAIIVEESVPANKREAMKLSRIVKAGEAVFANYKY